MCMFGYICIFYPFLLYPVLSLVLNITKAEKLLSHKHFLLDLKLGFRKEKSMLKCFHNNKILM